MSHQDRTSDIVINHETLKQVVDWLLPAKLFRGLQARGNARWLPRMLAVAALFWAASEKRTLTERLEQARKIVNKIFRWLPAAGETYQGFVKMLRKWHAELLIAIIPEVRVRMQEVLSNQWRIAGYVVFAGDGSRIELARTESLEAAFSPRRKAQGKKASKKGKGRRSRAAGKVQRSSPAKSQSAEAIAKKGNSPQMWLTLMWHVGTGLPWAWRTGPSDSSERGHLEQMLAELPEKSLLTADAGFVGYDFWTKVLNAGHPFVIRVGGNVRLLRELGYGRQHAHTVYLWPDEAAKKKQPPLVLRLIEIHDGKQSVYLVTNLTKSELSDRQAAQIYAARWGIELFFRTFKQTFGRRKLRSHSAENADLEVDWSLLALWCLCLLGQRELVEHGADPTRLSPAAAIKALQRTMSDYRLRPECREESLWAELRLALLDDYERTATKTSRNYPRQKKRERPGPPKITFASQQQIEAAQQLTQNELESRLSA
jgi:hypothetical protein